MRRLMFTFIISVLCISLALYTIDYNSVAIITLFALSVSFMIELNSGEINSVIYCLFFVFSLFYPQLIFVYPIVIFRSSRVNKYLIFIPIIAFFMTKSTSYIIIVVSVLGYFIDSSMEHLEAYKLKLIQTDDLYRLQMRENKINQLKLLGNKEKDIEIAILSERNRIAREIHDSVGHTISGAIIQTEAMRIENNRSLNLQIDSLQNNLKSGMAEIRSALHNMHDKSIDLKIELEEVTQSNSQLTFDLNYKITTELRYKAKQQILFIVKEAIANSIKHSNCDEIKISLIEMPKHINITITDNGKFENDTLEITNGIGFTSFYEFAKEYKGRFSYDINQQLKLIFVLDKSVMISEEK